MKSAPRTIQEINLDNSLRQRYENYLAHADNGKGIDITTGEPMKTFEQWLEG